MAASPSSSMVGLLQLAGRVACLIVVAWFAVFAVEQTSNASAHQQSELNGAPPASSSASSTSSGTSTAGAGPTSSSSQGATPSHHESTPHKVLNETATVLTAPFAAVVAGSHSEWVLHIVKTLLALLLYGVAIGYLVRIVRVRV